MYSPGTVSLSRSCQDGQSALAVIVSRGFLGQGLASALWIAGVSRVRGVPEALCPQHQGIRKLSPEWVTLFCCDPNTHPKLAAAVMHLWDFPLGDHLLFKVLLPKSLQNETLQLYVDAADVKVVMAS